LDIFQFPLNQHKTSKEIAADCTAYLEEHGGSQFAQSKQEELDALQKNAVAAGRENLLLVGGFESMNPSDVDQVMHRGGFGDGHALTVAPEAAFDGSFGLKMTRAPKGDLVAGFGLNSFAVPLEEGARYEVRFRARREHGNGSIIFYPGILRNNINENWQEYRVAFQHRRERPQREQGRVMHFRPGAGVTLLDEVSVRKIADPPLPGSSKHLSFYRWTLDNRTRMFATHFGRARIGKLQQHFGQWNMKDGVLIVSGVQGEGAAYNGRYRWSNETLEWERDDGPNLFIWVPPHQR
jgi:hypothetical protein